MRDYKELYREAKGQKTRIYCDMDGVLADFMVAAKKATGMTFKQSESEIQAMDKQIKQEIDDGIISSPFAQADQDDDTPI